MPVEHPLQVFNQSSFLLSSTLTMHCEKLLSLVTNRTASLNKTKFTPPYIQELLSKANLSSLLPKNIPECIRELSRLGNNIDQGNLLNSESDLNNGLYDHSRSLIVFVFLITLVSIVSVIGNLCLARVLYVKRFRLSQTDRIVLCLAISELCLVLIDSPTEIYRFLSFSFSITWLCRFHTFCESFFSSCIIFYHLLGAFDRFVYIHGHTSSDASSWSKWCRRISTKSGSIVLLILPMLCSLPIAIVNLLHANVVRTSSKMKICTIQYTHGLLIGFLTFFYIMPLLFAFFLHAKLIYFIRSKHSLHYLQTTSNMIPMKRNNTSDSQLLGSRKQRLQNPNVITQNQHLLQPQKKKTTTTVNQCVVLNGDGRRNIAGTRITATTGGQQGATNTSSNSSASSRSSTGTSYASLTSPIILYKVNSQANANAKRTVILLALLLSFYILCWAPYNIYTWRHAYQLATDDQNQIPVNRVLSSVSNLTITSLTDNLHSNLRRIIFINYSLYLLSMISMCFSFVFYFSLNKQARIEFSHMIGCICSQSSNVYKEQQRRKVLRQDYEIARHPQYHTWYQQQQHLLNNQILSSPPNNNARMKTMRFNTHPMIVPPGPLLADRQNKGKRPNSLSPKLDNAASKRTAFTYGCHVQCCP